MIWENTKANVYHVTILENGEEGYEQDFLVVVTRTEHFGFHDEPYYLITVLDDEKPTFTCRLGEIGYSDLDVLIRELVTERIYSRDEPEYDESYDSVTYEQIAT